MLKKTPKITLFLRLCAFECYHTSRIMLIFLAVLCFFCPYHKEYDSANDEQHDSAAEKYEIDIQKSAGKIKSFILFRLGSGLRDLGRSRLSGDGCIRGTQRYRGDEQKRRYYRNQSFHTPSLPTSVIITLYCE